MLVYDFLSGVAASFLWLAGSRDGRGRTRGRGNIGYMGGIHSQKQNIHKKPGKMKSKETEDTYF